MRRNFRLWLPEVPLAVLIRTQKPILTTTHLRTSAGSPSKRIHHHHKKNLRIPILKQDDLLVKLAIIRWNHWFQKSPSPSIPSTFTWIHWHSRHKRQKMVQDANHCLEQAEKPSLICSNHFLRWARSGQDKYLSNPFDTFDLWRTDVIEGNCFGGVAHHPTVFSWRIRNKGCGLMKDLWLTYWQKCELQTDLHIPELDKL